jgi:hypothetical protein
MSDPFKSPQAARNLDQRNSKNMELSAALLRGINSMAAGYQYSTDRM